MKVLPESFLRCLTKKQRKDLGQMSAAEALAKAEVKNERALQILIVNLLRLHGIEPFASPLGRKSRMVPGMPDILFATFREWEFETETGYTQTDHVNLACAWELKHDAGECSKEQLQMHIRMSTPPNCWRIKIIRSVQDGIDALRELGLEQMP